LRKCVTFQCSATEIIHSIGLCLLVYVVLPDMDIVRGIILLNGVAVLPSLLYPICASEPKLHADERRRGFSVSKMWIVILNTTVAIIQFAFIPVVLLFESFIETSYMDRNPENIVMFIVAMVFVSCSWWENFTDDRFCGKTNKKSASKSWILGIKFDLQEARPIVSFFTSFFKIGITCLFAYLAMNLKPFAGDDEEAENHSFRSITALEAFSSLARKNVKENAAILTLTTTSFVGYYVGYTACKLKLQGFSFSFPLIISTPLAVLVASFDCRHNWLWPFTNEERNECSDNDTIELIGLYVVGALVWLSIYWLCRHIFFPNIERLARTERYNLQKNIASHTTTNSVIVRLRFVNIIE